ncbi:MAG: riboflavin synthase [Planctomycetota bacterium]|nr:riboflavin synthase [Planctomycetota bacterium]
MFTGLVEEVSTLRSVSPVKGGSQLSANCSAGFAKSLAEGDSVAVNGCCLTVVSCASDYATFEAVQETVSRTTLRHYRPGSRVNLERALRADGRLGGHFVQGHVDGLAQLTDKTNSGLEWRMTFALPAHLAELCIPKGSVALNGVSLTIAQLSANRVTVAVIPHTYENTNLSSLAVGDEVNVETDVLGKYVAKFLGKNTPDTDTDNHAPIDEDFLRKHGF